MDALGDLHRSLASRGSALVTRRGDVVDQVWSVVRETASTAVFLAEDVSGYAQARERRLRRAAAAGGFAVHALPGVTVVPPGDLVPSRGGDAYSVFTPYWRRWQVAPRRAILDSPSTLASADVESWRLPALRELADSTPARSLPRGGETPGRVRLEHWLRDGLGSYEARRDELEDGATSGLSAYLHFGCLSPSEVEQRARALPGGIAFARQLCWRDFHHQLLAARPEIARDDFRPRGDAWRDDTEALAAWGEGQTGYPLVDAGMRQLLAEGTMPNRARLVAASFLTKHLYLDWRLGADHFHRHLVDGDVANNVGNWQWVAGTGADTRPNRVFNPTRQGKRYDPDGRYVRRWVTELDSLPGGTAHEPSREGSVRYPKPLVEHDEASARFARMRGR
jgi:deoxyribodipyrimidine photo-lyase